MGRERWQGTERWEGVGFYKARRTLRAKTSACPTAFSRARARSFPDVSAISTLFSTVIFILYLIFISTSLLSTLFFLLENRVGDDGVPAILQYRSSDLYPTDRKETMAILQKDTHTPIHKLQIRPSLVHPFLPQDKLLIQMHLDVPCNAWASC